MKTTIKILVVLTLMLALMLPGAGTVHAANLTVTTTDDELNADGDCSLREAIQAANTDTAVDACPAGAGADTITVPATHYILTLSHLFIDKDLTITGSGMGSTIIEQINPNFRVFDIGNPVGPAPVVSISRLTIMGGHAISPSNSEALPGHTHGGGIHNHGILTLTNVTITGNSSTPANDRGGGIYNAGTAMIVNVTIADNSAPMGLGGGIGGAAPTLTNTIVANNTGGNCPDPPATITITGSHNLQFPGTTCAGTITMADPMLGPLTNGVYPLLVGNPNTAIDMGTNTGCPPTDELGTARPQGAACDIGAFELDNTHPSIASVVRVNPDPTTASSVDFTVTFSEAVSGVDTSDFTLATTGSLTSTSVTGVNGSGTTYTVTVNTGSGSGTIRLDVIDDDSIIDNANNPLGGMGTGNGNFSGGQSYTINRNTAPTDVNLSPSSVAENQPAGTIVGTFTTVDPDLGDIFTYALVSGTGSTDNAAFTIRGEQLMTAYPFNALTKNSYSIRVRTTDSGSLTFEKVFTITVTDQAALFSDVPDSYWAVSWIERLYNAGITGGCSTSPLMYCPEDTVTRAQIAVFLERGIHGSSFTPPPASGSVFTDVPASYWAAAWIEKLAADNITGGCGGGNYCPDNTVTRAEMAVFLLRAEHGSSYTPPAATGVFSDVPTSSWAASWIEQLAAEGITSGCGGGNYCPDSPVTRAQMAVFLVKVFNLP